jgi:hypothetical protein
MMDSYFCSSNYSMLLSVIYGSSFLRESFTMLFICCSRSALCACASELREYYLLQATRMSRTSHGHEPHCDNPSYIISDLMSLSYKYQYMTCKKHRYCALTSYWKSLNKYILNPCYVCACVYVCTVTDVYVSIILATFRTQTSSQPLTDRLICCSSNTLIVTQCKYKKTGSWRDTLTFLITQMWHDWPNCNRTTSSTNIINGYSQQKYLNLVTKHYDTDDA